MTDRERIARAIAQSEDAGSDWERIKDADFAQRFWRAADAVLAVLEGPFTLDDVLGGPVAFDQGTLWFVRNVAERSGYTIIDEAHDVPETASTGRQHVLHKSCWCNPTMEGTTVVHRRGIVED